MAYTTNIGYVFLGQLSCLHLLENVEVNSDCLGVNSLCDCLLISLAHTGSVLIDLLNAEIDCTEAEKLY